MTTRPSTLAAGARIGRYVLGPLLGEGGFGLVFAGRDVDLDREVALKFLHAEHTANPEILRRFLQEARSAARIAHPGIVTVFECGQLAGDGLAFIAMEHLHGESLARRLGRGPLAIAMAVEIGRQIASALDAAHGAGIIHRDLKPDNVFLVRDPAMPCGERVKILDFGIAKLARLESGAATRSQVVFGTPLYMSPEQCRSAANIDHRSDIYALGCILYELVCGTPPFDGEPGELIAKHQLVGPVPARARQPSIPAYLDLLITQLLAKDPGERPQTMAAVQHVLELGARGIDAGVAPTLPPDAGAHGPPVRSAPTTLGGESVSRVPIERSGGRRRAVLVAVPLLALAAVGGWLGLGERARGARESDGSPRDEPARSSRPSPVAEIELELRSTPAAEVYLVVDGRLVGETPYRTTRPATEGSLVFVLKAPGYRDQRVAMPADRSGRREVALVELPAATPPPSTARPRSPSPTRSSPSATRAPPPTAPAPLESGSAVPVESVSRCSSVTCAAGFTCRATDGACVVDTIEVYR